MRTALSAALAATLALTPVAAGAQSAAAAAAPPAAAEAPAADDWAIDRRLLAIGAGAVVGIAAFNVLTVPLGTVPLAGGALAAVPMDIALGSRLLAGVSGAAGALLATVAYDAATGERHDYGYLAALGIGALGGIAVGNILGGHIGTLPFYAGSGVNAAARGAAGYASAAGQAASRIHVIASGVIGAWVADYLYGAK